MIPALGLVVLAASALVAHAQLETPGTIDVWRVDSSKESTPADRVGCLDKNGRFINPKSNADCAVFTRLQDYPYTMLTSEGHCTFNDKTQEANTDSQYGSQDHAFHCLNPWTPVVYDSLYTIGGFNYVFLCSGDTNCFFDAKKVPAQGETTSIWVYRWGSGQLGITPGHVQLRLVWKSV